jgi:excisionase family DNA binding protein
MNPSELLSDGSMSVLDAAKFLGVGRSYLYNAMERGELRYVRLGRRRLIPKRELVRFAAENLTGGWAIPKDEI